MVYAKAGEKLYLSPELEAYAKEEQRAAMERDDRKGWCRNTWICSCRTPGTPWMSISGATMSGTRMTRCGRTAASAGWKSPTWRSGANASEGERGYEAIGQLFHCGHHGENGRVEQDREGKSPANLRQAEDIQTTRVKQWNIGWERNRRLFCSCPLFLEKADFTGGFAVKRNGRTSISL